MPPVRNLAQEAEQATSQIVVRERDPASVDLPEELQELRGRFREVTGLQRAGLYLAWALLITIIVALAVVVVDWLVVGPAAPDVTTADADEAKTVVENYKAARDAALDTPKQLFTLVVSGGLVPLFTLLLGYIFGTQQTGGSEEG